MGAHYFEDREKSNTGVVEIKMSTESAEEFFQLDEEMQKTLQELEARGDSLVDVFEEFSKLHRSFTNVHASEVRYLKRTEELTKDIGSVKTQMADMQEEDEARRERKERLQGDIERTWKAVAESNAKESKKKNKNKRLKNRNRYFKNRPPKWFWMDKRAAKYNEWFTIHARRSNGEIRRKTDFINANQVKRWGFNYASPK